MNRRFRPRSDAPRLSPDQANRQGEASRLAFEAFRASDLAVAFLNTHDDSVGGRPIDIAIASPDGLLSVRRMLAERMQG